MPPSPHPLAVSAPFDPQPEPASLAWLQEQWAQLGDCFVIPPVSRRSPSLFVNDAEAVDHVLKGNRRNYVKGVGFERVEMLLGNGIITSDGDQWRRQRTMIQPAFKTGRIATLQRTMADAAAALTAGWDRQLAAADDEAPSVNVTREMSEFGLEVILRALFSDDYESLTGPESGSQFAFLATQFERDLRFAHRFRKLTGPIGDLIEDRLASGRRPDDLLSGLLDARHRATGTGMTRRELIDEVTTLIVAGHETSAGTLNWVWYELARHPEVEAQVLEELAGLPAEASTSLAGPGPSDLLTLKYTRQVLDECLRLYPPVWMFSRKALEADTVLGQPVEAGTNVFVSPYLMHRNSRYWSATGQSPGESLQDFNPAHFDSPPAVASSFIPFSAGSRRCIGEHFSYLEMLTLLAAALPRFQLSLEDAEPVPIEAAVNLRSARDIVMHLQRRSPN
ncbi:MAG: cytochrome P450 [Pseudomonadota bacterium]